MWTTCPRLLCSFAPSRIWTHDLLIASPTLYPLHHRATFTWTMAIIMEVGRQIGKWRCWSVISVWCLSVVCWMLYFRLHCSMHVLRCGLLLQMCISCLSVQKWLNQSWCCWLGLTHMGPRNHVLHEGHDPPPGGALLRVDICRHVVTYLHISALGPSQACPAHTVEMGCYIWHLPPWSKVGKMRRQCSLLPNYFGRLFFDAYYVFLPFLLLRECCLLFNGSEHVW